MILADGEAGSQAAVKANATRSSALNFGFNQPHIIAGACMWCSPGTTNRKTRPFLDRHGEHGFLRVHLSSCVVPLCQYRAERTVGALLKTPAGRGTGRAMDLFNGLARPCWHSTGYTLVTCVLYEMFSQLWHLFVLAPAVVGHGIVWEPSCPSAVTSLNSTLPIVCGSLAVPLDYSNTSSNETLVVPIYKIPVANGTTSKNSVLLNFGGPGNPGLDSFAANASALQL